MPILIHHEARCGGGAPGGPAALRACVETGAQVIEIDITPLGDGNFLLAHDRTFERFSDGAGPVGEETGARARRLHYLTDERVTGEPLGLLEDALALLAGSRVRELQLDLKLGKQPLSQLALNRLIEQLAPYRDRIRVTSAADWALYDLHRLDPALPIGFDPLYYLDLKWPGTAIGLPPVRVGAHGYHDDHPLALEAWGSATDYLAARAEILWSQLPFAAVWYIRAQLLARVLDDGFDWIARLHARGAEVAAWTLDPDQPHQLDLARQLAAAGVDRITTNDAAGLAAGLGRTQPKDLDSL
jgi:glycerophosphoryl diester phosphodiesterase